MTNEEVEWVAHTMAEINRLTPDIHGKAFNPDWFLLRQRFEEIARKAFARPEGANMTVVRLGDKHPVAAPCAIDEQCKYDSSPDAKRYRALRDSGIAVSAWQDVDGVHWAVNGVEYLNLNDGADALLKRERAPQERDGS